MMVVELDGLFHQPWFLVFFFCESLNWPVNSQLKVVEHWAWYSSSECKVWDFFKPIVHVPQGSPCASGKEIFFPEKTLLFYDQWHTTALEIRL